MKIELDPRGFNELRICRSGPMLYNKNDAYIGASLRKYGEFCWLEFEDVLSKVVRPGALVVDAGANIGTHTVEFSRLAGAEGAVFAFEPQRLVFQALCANLAINQCINVTAYREALGDETGEIVVPLYDPSERSNFGAVALGGHTGGERVPLHTLDSLELPACHVLKADIEGMELELLRGAARTIARYRPFIYVENHLEDRSAALIETLFGFDYQLWWHVVPFFNPHNFAGDPEDIFPGTVSVNMVCFPAEVRSSVSGMRRVESPGDSWKQ
jgi:FkbM family methyltransferase